MWSCPNLLHITVLSWGYRSLTFPSPPSACILCIRTRWCRSLCFLISFPGWRFRVNILKMKGPIKVQTVHFICMAPYMFQRLSGPFIYQLRRIRPRQTFRGWKLVALCCILYLRHRYFLFVFKIIFEPVFKSWKSLHKKLRSSASLEKSELLTAQNRIPVWCQWTEFCCPLGSCRLVLSFAHLHLPGLQVPGLWLLS